MFIIVSQSSKSRGKMILNPEWQKPKEKPYFHQISMNCLEKLVDCIGRFNKGEIDADTSCQIEKQILTDEIQDQELLNFAVENISEWLGSACSLPKFKKLNSTSNHL